MKHNTILLTHTDLDGYGSKILLSALGIKAKVVNLENNRVDAYVLEMIRRMAEGEMEKPNNLYFTDINFSEEVAEKLNELWESDPVGERMYLRLFDHHASALHLNQYAWAEVVVKETAPKECGTSLFYNHLKNELRIHIPSGKKAMLDNLVENIRLYDVWEWAEEKLPAPKMLNDLFYLVGSQAFVQSRLTWLTTHSDNLFTKREQIILEVEGERISQYLKDKQREMVIVDDFFQDKDGNYYSVGVVQADSYTSELGNHLCNVYQDIDFAVLVNFTRNRVSYRSTKVDLTPIAKKFGGGGHPPAAGSSLEALGEEFVLKAVRQSFTALAS